MTDELVIAGLEVSIGGKKILKGLDLAVRQGEVHALMGPNGSGKTSLAYALMGHPDYVVDAGTITWRGQNLLDGPTPAGLSPDKRARMGLFLAFQYPSAIPGVTVASFLRNIYNAIHHPKPADESGETSIKYTGIPLAKFRKLMEEKMALLHMDPGFAARYVNEGFSGGEKKRHEILQMALLRPELCILDETDSGLDVDALRVVAEGVNRLRGPQLGVLLITHYTRILRYISPDVVHVMVDGRVVQSGGPELADQLESEGYERWRGDPAT
ncbi:MAG TPA: Fe-S cluster assembly ATPase SufC [Actinomycetota bacterium]|nr:Fe-S cluster assembly ATPase SufC [Actinomycetota bacterium]